jgi:hypothetical protein
MPQRTMPTPLRRLILATGLVDDELSRYLSFKLNRSISTTLLTKLSAHRESVPPQDIVLMLFKLIKRQDTICRVAEIWCEDGSIKNATEFKLKVLEAIDYMPHDQELSKALAYIDLYVGDLTRTVPTPDTDKTPQQYSVSYVPLGRTKPVYLSYPSEQAAWTGAKAHICEANPQEPIVIHRERWLKSENGWKVVQVTHPIKAGDLEPRWLPYGILEAPKISERV